MSPAFCGQILGADSDVDMQDLAYIYESHIAINVSPADYLALPVRDGKGSAATLVPEAIQMGIRTPNSRTIQVLSLASRRLLLRSVKLQIVR